MRTWMFAVMLAFAASTVAMADAVESVADGIPIDFPTYQPSEDVARLIDPVGLLRGDDGSTRRFYLAPIVGASWGQLLVPDQLFANQGLFTAGGAAGVAITRPTTSS